MSKPSYSRYVEEVIGWVEQHGYARLVIDPHEKHIVIKQSKTKGRYYSFALWRSYRREYLASKVTPATLAALLEQHAPGFGVVDLYSEDNELVKVFT